MSLFKSIQRSWTLLYLFGFHQALLAETYRICRLHALISTAYFPPAVGSGSISRDFIFSFHMWIAISTLPVKIPNCFPWSFLNVLLSNAAISVDPDKEEWNVFQIQKKQQSSAIFLGGINSLIATAVQLYNFIRRRQMTWPSYYNILVKRLHCFNWGLLLHFITVRGSASHI